MIIIGITKNPVISAGANTRTTVNVSATGTKASKIIDIKQPVPNIIKSNGLNTPSISIPFFVFAGIK